jgi:general stress protein 26
VVVGVFSMMDHSTKFTKQLLKEGYDVNVALNPKNKFYYVYIFSTYDLEEARKARNQYRWKNLFKEAWVFTME